MWPALASPPINSRGRRRVVQ